MYRFHWRTTDNMLFECVMADTFSEAKHKVFQQYSWLWNQIEWLNPNAPEEQAEQASDALPVVITV